MHRARRLPLLILVVGAFAIVFAGCSGIKPGSVSLSQPAGIGPVQLNTTFCTLPIEGEALACGPPGGKPTQAQHLLVLVVPVGTTAPATIAAVSSAGATPTSFTRNQQVAAAFAAAASPEAPLPPPGFELAGYISGEVAEAPARADEWALSAALVPPPGAGGGSSGLPFRTAVLGGWREVSGAQPASRPVFCSSAQEIAEAGAVPPSGAACGTQAEPGNEPTLGISDLKIKSPVKPSAVPGAKVKLPFVLDFASSAAQLPTFRLAASSKLPGAKVSVSNNAFSRGPSDPATNRAPATTRQAIVEVPATAKLGSYEVLFSATANLGGVVTAAATLSVEPNGKPQVTAPKKFGAVAAAARGIPVKLVSPIAGSRFVLTLKGPKPSGKGKVRLAKKIWVAKEAGPGSVKLRIPASKAQAILASGGRVALEAKVRVPGAKAKKLTRTLKLR